MPRLLLTRDGYAQALGQGYVFGDAEDDLAFLRKHVVAIRKEQEEQARLKYITTTATIAGALFAAGKLGLVAIPFIKARRR